MDVPVQEPIVTSSDKVKLGNSAQSPRPDLENENQVSSGKEVFTQETIAAFMQTRIDKILDKSGRFLIALLVLISINSAIVAISHALPTFHSYTPRFFCRDEGDIGLEGCVGANDTCEAGYEFEKDDNTIVSEWELVCSRVLLKPLVSTFYYSGVTVGAVVGGILADKYGRYLIMLICLYAQCGFGLSLFAAQNLNTFIVLRTIQGIFVQGLQSSSFALLMELCPSRHRTAIGVFWEICWTFGCAFLGGISYVVVDWRWLQIALAIPSILTLSYIWIIPESPSWLASVGKYSKAQKVCEKLAKLNGTKEITEQDVIEIPSICHKRSLATSSKEKKKSTNDVIAIIKSKILRKFGLIMIFTWFSVTMAYFGLMFYIPNLYGQRHVNFVIGTGIEAISFVISYWVMLRFGRKHPIIVYQISTGVTCGIAAVILYIINNPDATVGTLVTVLVLISKGCAVSSFCIMYIYVIELFPTTVRGVALGICGFWSRIGSLLSPQIIVLGEYTHSVLPLILIGVFNCVSGFACIALPETLGTKLVNTVEESEQLFDTKKKLPNHINK